MPLAIVLELLERVGWYADGEAGARRVNDLQPIGVALVKERLGRFFGGERLRGRAADGVGPAAAEVDRNQHLHAELLDIGGQFGESDPERGLVQPHAAFAAFGVDQSDAAGVLGDLRRRDLLVLARDQARIRERKCAGSARRDGDLLFAEPHGKRPARGAQWSRGGAGGDLGRRRLGAAMRMV